LNIGIMLTRRIYQGKENWYIDLASCGTIVFLM